MTILKLPRRKFLHLAAGAALLPALPSAARAQAYPWKPIKLILPFLPGTPNDVIARLIAPDLSSRLGQAVVVDNRSGGGTLIGTKAAMTAEADGHTLLVTSTSVHVIAQSLTNNIAYDPIGDFAAVASIGTTSWVLVISPAVPAKSLAEFLAYARANPGKMNFGYGQGTGPQLVGAHFKRVTGIDLANVPYRGSTQVVADMLGGQVQVNFSTADILPLVREGKLTALAVTSATRSPDFPELPTMIESGYPAMTLTSTVGILAPARTPANVTNRVYREITESLKSPELRSSILKTGYEPEAGSPESFAALVAEEMKKWLPIAKESGFRID